MEMLTTFSASSPSHHHKIFTYYSISKNLNSDSLHTSIFSPKFYPHYRARLSSNITTRPSRCLSASLRPPPPDSDSPGLVGKLTKFQDRVRIFVAVLFWMSLFFWYSAWDGRNSGKPPNRGSPFRR